MCRYVDTKGGNDWCSYSSIITIMGYFWIDLQYCTWVCTGGGDWRVPPTFHVWFNVFGVCSVGAAAHYLLNYAGRIAPAGLVSRRSII